ncbi:(2Fe-2S)-binding protein [Luteitalea sp. TBR-22]|uniref:(2Fe-2S)-binding protein n=1 Tax=Luteitalea sp. TBR-22 TaxID=2802971 RepID=UPI001EF54F1A|nr:(2Fe-2S)-binding protein [Luteitalea sp. TBR-22]
MAPVSTTITVNGHRQVLSGDSRTSLLDLLRDRLGLTGTRKGCNHGACGACTVHIDGRPALACLTLTVTCHEREVTTIEGIGAPDGLHPLQEAFVAHEALQCGFCTAGQVMSALGCLAEGRARSADEVREWMSGNLCRCGAYHGIATAILQLADGK